MFLDLHEGILSEFFEMSEARRRVEYERDARVYPTVFRIRRHEREEPEIQSLQELVRPHEIEEYRCRVRHTSEALQNRASSGCSWERPSFEHLAKARAFFRGGGIVSIEALRAHLMCGWRLAANALAEVCLDGSFTPSRVSRVAAKKQAILAAIAASARDGSAGALRELAARSGVTVTRAYQLGVELEREGLVKKECGRLRLSTSDNGLHQQRQPGAQG